MAPFKDPVFYTPSNGIKAPEIIDFAKVNASGIYVGEVSSEPLEQIAKRYPGAVIGEMAAVVAQKEAMLISDPQEITEDDYIDALEVLPPADWVNLGNQESFKCCENLSGRVTYVYARLGKQFFSFKDVQSIRHAAIVEKIRNHLNAPLTTPA